ncbi:hypothetical protein DPMN_112560 [Dreissena polymorpha]|uniref:Uncharacterized protein n=1 Tax=Dreissena polymorpha TaxID=45954 RepID=A0A9D4KGB8_DREPO|nr:hypothetical protein DPMN_112560 [Dreissena polymorpha]
MSLATLRRMRSAMSWSTSFWITGATNLPRYRSRHARRELSVSPWCCRSCIRFPSSPSCPRSAMPWRARNRMLRRIFSSCVRLSTFSLACPADSVSPTSRVVAESVTSRSTASLCHSLPSCFRNFTGACFQLEKPSVMKLPSTFVLPILPVFLATMQRWQNARSRL